MSFTGRILVIALSCIGLLGACAWMVSSAQASLYFEADAYPPTVQAEGAYGVVGLETEAGRVNCATGFDKVMSGPESALALAPAFSGCDAFGIAKAAVKPEGCVWILHPTRVVAENEFAAHVDLSCPAGQSLKVTAENCEVEFKSQEGLTTIGLTNDLAASPDQMGFWPTVSGVRYTVAKDGAGCPFNGTGAKFDGLFVSSKSLTMTGTGSGSGLRLGGSGTGEEGPVSSTPRFEASSYPALVSGSGGKGVFNFQLEAGSVECNVNAFTDGTLAEASPRISFGRVLFSCSAFGLGSAVVKAEECRYELHARRKIAADEFDSHLNLVCPAGKAIKITVSTCSVEIKSQWMLYGVFTGVKIVNDTASSPYPDITVTPGVGTLLYLVTQDGFGCPFAGTGLRSTGAINGSEALRLSAEGAGISVS